MSTGYYFPVIVANMMIKVILCFFTKKKRDSLLKELNANMICLMEKCATHFQHEFVVI